MEGLAKILGACISPLDLALLTTLTSHRSNPAEGRQAVGIGPTVSLRAKYSGATKQEQDLFINDAKIVRDLWSINRIPNEGPQHRVRINRPFFSWQVRSDAGARQAVMGDNPSWFKFPSGPVEQIGWDEVRAADRSAMGVCLSRGDDDILALRQ